MTNYEVPDLSIELTPMTCGVNNCGVPHAVTTAFYRRAAADHSIYWYCPNGHHIHFTGKSTDDKLKDAEAAKLALRDQLEAATRDAETLRTALLRDRQRFANGVCPCCNRSFEQLRRHMTTKHPDYDATRIQQPSAARFACTCGRSFETLRGLKIHQGASRYGEWYVPDAPAWRAHLTKV